VLKTCGQALPPTHPIKDVKPGRRQIHEIPSTDDRVVITRIEAEEKTSSGIVIPGYREGKPQEGEVIAVGPGGRDDSGKLIPLDVEVSDRVLFGKWSGTEVNLEGVGCSA
jgi:chaperonin GroES